MRNLFSLTFLASAFVMAGCSSDEISGEVQHIASKDAVVAYIPNARTTMNGKSVLWEEGDVISVFSIAPGNNYLSNKYDLEKGAGSSTATFGGMLTGEKKCAFYPYSDNSTWDGSKIIYTLPSAYAYKENVNNLAPMFGTLGSNGMSFKNLCALIKITIGNIPAGMNKVILTSGGRSALPIAGKAEITVPAQGSEAELTMATEATGKEVSITFDATGGLSTKTFYFPVPAGTYPELKFEVSNGNETKEVKKVTTFIVGKNDLKVTEVTFDQISAEIPTTVNSTTEVINELRNGSNTVEVKDVPSQTPSPTIELPKSSNPSTNVVAISFGNVSTETPIEVKEETSGEGTAAKNVRIAMPAQTTTTPSVNVDLENSTVSLGAVNTETTYDKVTASTADETLIIESGVTVNELTINKGSVKIFGTVTTLTIDSNSNTTKVLVYPGGSCSTFTDNRQEGKITLSYVPGDPGENEGYTGGDKINEWD